jgi:hypothetical protein
MNKKMYITPAIKEVMNVGELMVANVSGGTTGIKSSDVVDMGDVDNRSRGSIWDESGEDW